MLIQHFTTAVYKVVLYKICPVLNLNAFYNVIYNGKQTFPLKTSMPAEIRIG
jgi:hypothetical protein